MFLKEFESDLARENFIKLAFIVSEDENLMHFFIKESGLDIDEYKMLNGSKDILAFRDSSDEFKDEILDLIDGANFKFYIDYLMLHSLCHSDVSLMIKELLEKKLSLSTDIINLCKTWAINTAYHAKNANSIINLV